MKRIIYGALCSLAVLLGCAQKVTPPTDEAASGLQAVQLSSKNVFNGDPAKLPGGEVWTAWEKSNQLKGPAGLGKSATALASIDFKEAKVIVLWYNYMYMAGLTSDNSADFICDEYQNLYTAFSKQKPLDKWENVLAGCRDFPNREVVYSGTLKKAGEYLEGTVYVKPGWNWVTVAFIDVAGKMFYTTHNVYINMSGFGKENDDYYSSLGWLSGWADDTWTSRDYDSTSGYSFPGISLFESKLGITKEDADASCASAHGVIPGYPN